VIFGAATFATLGTTDRAPADTMKTQMNSPTERVVGIGGLFFRSADPKKLTQWYQDHLGIDQPSWKQLAGPTAFNPFPMSGCTSGDCEYRTS